jgi:uncharacterized protein
MKTKLFLFSIILFSNYCFGIKPSRVYVANPKTYNFDYKETQIQTSDNISVNTWNITPKKENKNKVTIILCGTDAGNMSYFLAYALTLANEGYNVISFDYRGFGKSQDFKIDTTLLFHNEFLLDFEAVVQYTKKLYPNNKIGTLGFSMGGYFPLITTMKLDFIIADSPLLNPIIFLERLNETGIMLPKNAVVPILKKEIPQFYFLGDQDKFIHFEDFQNNFVILYKGKHLEAAPVLKNQFYTFVDSFLSNLK